jgi:uncharacterized protein (DUF433 family)
VALIAGTRIKVSQLAIDAAVWGKTPAEIRLGYPQLTLGQVHAALGYYYDHKPQIDAQIEEDERFADEARAARPNPLTREDFEARLRPRSID